jgi:hypothetical protein
MLFNFKESTSAELEQIELPTVLQKIKEGNHSELTYFKPTFNDSIAKLTQVIYGEITGFNPEDIKDHLRRFPFIISTWCCNDGIGVGVLIQSEGLTIDNYRSNWKEIQDILGLEFGSHTSKFILKVELPFDEYIYINENVKPFIAIESNETFEVENNEVETVNKGNKFIYQTQFSPEVFNGKDYLVFPEGIDFLKVHLPKDGIILNELRGKVLPAIIATIIQLNHETKTKEEILKLTYALNNKRCVKPFSQKVFYDIFNDIYQHHLDGTMEVKFIKRKLIYNPDSNLTKKEKLSIAANLTASVKKDGTFNKLKSIIEEHGKITQVKVAELAECNVKTVKRHWSKLKPFIVKK